MPDAGLDSLTHGLNSVSSARMTALRDQSGTPDWAGWWEQLRADPVLAPATAERDDHFGHQRGAAHTESVLSSRWHIDAMLKAGCSEAGLVWRGLQDAAVLGRVR